ncbi:hypothetical protein Tco_0926180 [Tanacetum coccineum]|uniref:Uncharacterized protein n=1 Tax=Tanacetum coccineum TaxID=301880 RepID=A0ABQ5DBZ8_9ASTR
MGNALVKLVKKVKKLEGFFKRINMVLSDSEEEEPEAQGRKSQDDPLDSLVQSDWFTPSLQQKELEELIQLTEFNTDNIKLSTVSEQVSTGSAKRSTPSPDKGQRAGKAPMIIEETPKKSKEPTFTGGTSLAEANHIGTLTEKKKKRWLNKYTWISILAQRMQK